MPANIHAAFEGNWQSSAAGVGIGRFRFHFFQLPVLYYPSLNHYSGVWECFQILPPLSFESLVEFGNVFRHYLPCPSLNHYSWIQEGFKILPPPSFESLQGSLGMFTGTTSPILLWITTVEFGNVLRYYLLHPSLNHYNGIWECCKILLPTSFFESLQLNLGMFSDTTSPVLWIIPVEFGSVSRYYFPHPLNHYSGNIYRYYLPCPLNHYSGVRECF